MFFLFCLDLLLLRVGFFHFLLVSYVTLVVGRGLIWGGFSLGTNGGALVFPFRLGSSGLTLSEF